jgi:hypothetical protein
MLPSAGPELDCSLDDADMASRVTEWQVLARQASGRTPIEGGIRLTFAETDMLALADLVAREQSCCSFLSFVIALTPAGTHLDISGPAEALPMIEALA